MRALVVGLGVLLFAGCQGSTTPVRRDLEGSWESKAFAGATIRMTVSETAREVKGAGSWLTIDNDYGFDIGGTVADDEISLIFRFDTRPDINFQGYFEDPDIVTGWLTGDGYRRSGIRFERADLAE